MNLVIDAGNTLIKVAVFDKKQLIFQEIIDEKGLPLRLKEICDVYSKVKWGMVASVRNLDPKTLAVLSVFCNVMQLTQNTSTPYKNSYATASTLGVDRIALATAAFYHNPRGNTLVLDAGTCLTYDMVNDYGEYLGGAISPGLNMRYRALHEQTAKLPLLEKSDVLDFIGNSTETSIHSGVFNGMCAEIDGVIDQYKLRFRDLTVILTGGDADFLSKRLKNPIFANPNFLLEGLNYLLEYNKH
ncbi:type III pantothenate kinase [Aurantibacter crassamenti]|uniref:type III pantothenate kinase n=1 Tax=Aurantibacter crassamenti TaxID=1837375 RepID=UPI00193A5DD2|nr:type III pantothenate kinase [Aurantibacter crassamenti]MBM1104698.1 type III pantothenate kinase [Aurantibacter crassamenti]